MRVRLRQKAVYWAFSSLDENGEPIVADPVELSVRWEHGLAQEITPTTNPTAVDATVWVDRDIIPGSMFRNGPMSEIEETGTGTALIDDIDEILEVVEFQKVPDIKGKFFERVVLLRKYADSLPTVE